MKFRGLTLLLGILYFSYSFGQQKKYSLNQDNKSLQEVIKQIETETGHRFFFNNNQIDLSKKVSIHQNNKSIDAILSEIFAGTNIGYQFKDNNIILSRKTPQEQTVQINGQIRDIELNPVAGATISTGTNTSRSNQDGSFTIQAPVNGTLKVSYLGYKTQHIPINQKTTIVVNLVSDAESIDEVVVTALGVKREQKALGYAVQKVDGQALSTAKGVDVATSLTGRVAGMSVKNSTEFNTAPTINVRGMSPLIVIDGVATQFVSLRDIPADDIEDITVLKGASASALYGARGGSGAIMVTTKKSKLKGLDVQINSSNMFTSGYVAMPKVQGSYSSGQGGKYAAGSYVWGDKLDIGRTAQMYNPITMETEEQELVSKGKNNLSNFQRPSYILNNNISISQRGDHGGVRASLTHVFNQGQYENNHLNKITYLVNGDMTSGDFKFEGGLNYNKRFYPNMGATGYGGGGILYNLNVWSGTEYDIRDYKNYWKTPDEQQNWMDQSWYDNPYYIVNEIIHKSDYNILNGFLNTQYKSGDWLTINARLGSDFYSSQDKYQNPIGAVGGWNRLGYFSTTRAGGYSVNGDLMATVRKQINDFHLEGFIGTGINYRNNDSQNGTTAGGLSVPGFYSLKASVSPATTSSSLTRRQDNALYGRFTGSWKNRVFLEVTGRNDWSSTLDNENNSFFYPSVSSSIVVSDFFNLPEAINFWKIRGAWTRTKYAPGIYEINQQYSIASDVWQGLGTATYPTILRSRSIMPETIDSWEIGSEIHLIKDRINLDFTYYNTLKYNQQRNASISNASGFNQTQINIKEDLRRKGFEIALNANVIKHEDLNWSSRINWSKDNYYYDNIDPDYSTDKPWVKNGARWDWYGIYDWERDPSGNLIHYGGLPKVSNYQSVAGFTDPDFIWGWSNTFNYKNFTLNFSFDGRVGGVMHSVTDQAMWNSGSHPDSDNEYRYDMVVNGNKNYVGKGVKIVSGSVDYDNYGNITRDDRVFAENDMGVSYESYSIRMAPYIGSPRSQFVYSQTFLKLRDLSLIYKLPSNITGKIKARQASIGIIGQNLWLWSKNFKYSDPDLGTENLNSASIRYIGGNINIQF